MSAASLIGDLNLGHIIAATGLNLTDVVVVRHTYTAGGLESDADLNSESLIRYTRQQTLNNKLGQKPPRHWLTFMADGGRRSRYLEAYENFGEIVDAQTTEWRFFDLRPSAALSALADRLVIEWSRDAVNWAKGGATASAFPVLEIADPDVVPFPGFDRVIMSYDDLRTAMEDSRYAAWHTALGSVQGVYLIADTSTGQLYVGKADGTERILGRWMTYARDGHGGNKALRDLAGLDPSHSRHFQFSILRVFGPSVPTAEVDESEAHFKRALLSRKHGLNRN